MWKNEVTIKKRKVYIGNSVEVLIQLKEEHQGQLKLHALLVGRTRRNFF